MKNVCVVVGMIVLLGIVGGASATWTGITYDNATIKANINGGTDTDGYSINTGPASGWWSETFYYGGSYHPVNVYSANNINFSTSEQMTTQWVSGVSSFYIVKLNLAQWIYAFNWDPARNYHYVAGNGSSMDYKYSKDGVNWTTLYTVDNTSGGGYDNQADAFRSIGDTKTLYLGYFGTTGPGGYAMFETADSGLMSFWPSATPEPATLILLGLGGLAMLRRRNTMTILVGLVAVLGLASVGSATWTNIEYDNATTTLPLVNGGRNADGGYYSSVKPGSGTWSFNYSNNPSTSSPSVQVWSANYIRFDYTGISAKHAGSWGAADSSLVIKVALSTLTDSATWTPVRPYYVKTDDNSSVVLRYSTDGVNFTTAYTAPNNGVQNQNYPYYFWPGTLNLSFAHPTQSVYIEYAGLVGTGTAAYWEEFGGSMTFSNTPEPATLALLSLGGLFLSRRRKS